MNKMRPRGPFLFAYQMNVHGVLMICKIINLSDFYSHHSAEIALVNTPMTFSLTNSLGILPSSLPYLNFIWNLQFFFSYSILKIIYVSQEVLAYATVINNTHISVASNKVVYSSLTYTWFSTSLPFRPQAHGQTSLCRIASHFGKRKGEFSDTHPALKATAQTWPISLLFIFISQSKLDSQASFLWGREVWLQP